MREGGTNVRVRAAGQMRLSIIKVIPCLMTEAEVEIRKWGNSLAIIVPADIARAEDLHPNDRALLRIRKVKYPKPGSFGSLKGWHVDPQAVKDEFRADEAAREKKFDDLMKRARK